MLTKSKFLNRNPTKVQVSYQTWIMGRTQEEADSAWPPENGSHGVGHWGLGLVRVSGF